VLLLLCLLHCTAQVSRLVCMVSLPSSRDHERGSHELPLYALRIRLTAAAMVGAGMHRDCTSQ
jgi:hypothetical protein